MILGILNKISQEGANHLSTSSFIVSIILSYSLSFLLAQVYRTQSKGFSNPNHLAGILPIISIGTTIIISVVKSSLALSLGLVGALSIVRFRTPIKDPEELTYIFLTIAIGLATGSDQYKVALIGFTLIVVFIFLNKKLTTKENKSKTVQLTINGIYTNEIEKLINLLAKNTISINFNNLYTEQDNQELKVNLSLSLIPKEFQNINNIVNEISSTFPNSTLSIIDANIDF